METNVGLAFFILGLINNLLYVIALSAAQELIEGHVEIVLLALIVPNIIFKLLFPFITHQYAKNEYIRIIIYNILYISSFHFILWFDHSIAVRIIGLSLCSLSSSIGEVIFLQRASHIAPPYATNGWITGTAAAGIIGASLYLGLSLYLDMDYTKILLVVCPVPSLSIAAYLYVMTVYPYVKNQTVSDRERPDGDRRCLDRDKIIQWTRAIAIRYMSPLFLSFLLTYLINQGFAPSLEYTEQNGETWDEHQTYVYLMLCYQCGVFISRSSIMFFHINIRHVLVCVSATVILFIFILFEYVFSYMQHVAVPMFLFTLSGLACGAVYGNIVHALNINEKIRADRKQLSFSIGLVTFASDFGIAVAALIALAL